jgi:hypothetical protein
MAKCLTREKSILSIGRLGSVLRPALAYAPKPAWI